MARNIKAQVTHAVNNFGYEDYLDKHSIKKEEGPQMTNRVFSQDARGLTKDVSNNIQTFLKENYSDVKLVKDIKSNMVQEFLESKKDHCTQRTVNTYAETLFKIEKCLEKAYKIELNWKSDVVVPQAYKQCLESRGVNDIMSKEDYDKIKEYCSKDTSKASNALILMQGDWGVRVKALCNILIEKVDFEKNTIDIKDKNGIWVKRDLTPETRSILEKRIDELKKKGITEGKIYDIKRDSLNKQLTRIEKKLGLDTDKSIHSIRRKIAQAKYDEFREKGLSPKEAATLVSNYLGHGDNREAMLRECYIKMH